MAVSYTHLDVYKRQIILIATPILLPIATSIGIDPIQFGIIMVLNCGIGLLTPPVGAVDVYKRQVWSGAFRPWKITAGSTAMPKR